MTWYDVVLKLLASTFVDFSLYRIPFQDICFHNVVGAVLT